MTSYEIHENVCAASKTLHHHYAAAMIEDCRGATHSFTTYHDENFL
jgi:hypothetical protein